jgi:hypothetical protein
LDALNYRGAFVSVSQTVGGKAMDEVKLKNINTRGVWKDYTFYVTASSYAQTTFSITLGLGQNNGTNFEYVEGYAFFDNVNCTLMKTAALTGDADKTIDLSLTAEDRVINDGTGFSFDPVPLGLVVGGDDTERSTVVVLGLDTVIDGQTSFEHVNGFGFCFGDSFGSFGSLGVIGGRGGITAARGHDSGDEGQSREKECGNAGLIHDSSPCFGIGFENILYILYQISHALSSDLTKNVKFMTNFHTFGCIHGQI